MKIGIIANSNLWLEPLHVSFSKNHEVWWCCFERNVYERLVQLGYERVFYKEDPIVYEPNHSGNKFRYSNPGVAESEFLEKLSPDIIIVDNTSRLVNVEKKCFWVYSAHSYCYKSYTFHPTLLKYDAVLVPGEYYINEFPKRIQSIASNTELLPVGFPKLAALNNVILSPKEILSELNLNPSMKTGLYAPTWGGSINGRSWGNSLFSRWEHLDQLDILEKYLKALCDNNIQMIIKPHHVCALKMKNDLRFIANKYGAHFVEDDPSLISDPFKYIIAADYLVSDLSGIIVEFLSLNKPVVFIEPESELAWLNASIPKNMRFGPVVTNLDQLIKESINSVDISSDEFELSRISIKNKLLTYHSNDTLDLATTSIIRSYKSKRGMK